MVVMSEDRIISMLISIYENYAKDIAKELGERLEISYRLVLLKKRVE